MNLPRSGRRRTVVRDSLSLSYNPDGKWESNAENDENICREWAPGISVLRPIVPRCFERGTAVETLSIHFNESPDTADSLLKTVTAVSQLSYYRPVAKWYINRNLPETVR